MADAGIHSSGFQRRIVHLDLKGSRMPSSWLLSWLPVIKAWGATGILIEYEDMFPYTGELSFIPCPVAYTHMELDAIVYAATRLGLEVIPLVQTLGHAEFILKHSAASHLRERSTAIMDMCVCHPGTLPLVRGMMHQIAQLHTAAVARAVADGAPPPRSDMCMHVGLDEVACVAECERCMRVAAAVEALSPHTVEAHHAGHASDMVIAGLHVAPWMRLTSGMDTRSKLFMHHALAVTQIARELGYVALVWHDMIMSLHNDALTLLAQSRAQLCVWAYTAALATPHVKALVSHATAHGVQVWGSCAFRGAAAPDACAPIHAHRYVNTATWVAACTSDLTVQGLILTGWARFTHTCALCEPLPAALLSLCVCLAIASGRPGIASATLSDTDESAAVAISRAHLDSMLHSSSASCDCHTARETARTIHADDASLSLMEEYVPMDVMENMSDCIHMLTRHTSLPGCDMLRVCAFTDAVRSSLLRTRDARRMFVPPYTSSNTHAPEWARLIRSCVRIANAFVVAESALVSAAAGCLLDDDLHEFLATKLRPFRREALCLVEDMLSQVPSTLAHVHASAIDHGPTDGTLYVDAALAHMCTYVRGGSFCFDAECLSTEAHAGVARHEGTSPSGENDDMGSIAADRNRAPSRMSVDDDVVLNSSGAIEHVPFRYDEALHILPLPDSLHDMRTLTAHVNAACTLLESEAVVRARANRRRR